MLDVLPPASAAQGPVPPALIITGTLSNAETHYSLPGLLVRAFYQVPPEHVEDKKTTRRLLGHAVSDAAGRFALIWDPSPAVAQLLCLLACCDEAEYSLTVALSEHTPVLLTTPPSPAGKTAISRALLISLPAKRLTHGEWAELGDRAAAAGVATLAALVEQISRPSGTQSVARDWPLPKRQQAIGELERAFLDPRGTLGAIAPLPPWQALGQPGAFDAYRASLGAKAENPAVVDTLRAASLKLSAFNGLSEVDWRIDPRLFHQDVGAAITADQDSHFGAEPTLTPSPPYIYFAPEQGYRDYLRAQWTNDITLVSPVPPLELTLAQADQQLRNRFHQDFSTTKTGKVVANEVLIPILTEILTAAPGGTFGFGVAAKAIPARTAGMPARAYLDILIGLTKLSAAELSLRYRLDFARSDGAISSPVWENIYTLQGFFRDSFQSVPDPVNTTPDILGQAIIPDMMALQSPFFLEYDEWLLLQDPVPLENFVQPRLVFVMDVSPESRKWFSDSSTISGTQQKTYQFILKALSVYDTLVKAYQSIDVFEYKQGLDALDIVENLLDVALSDPLVGTVDLLGEFGERRTMKVNSLDDLHAVMVKWQFVWTVPVWHNDGELALVKDRLVCALVYFKIFSLPTVRAEAQLALGDYVPAVRGLGRAAGLVVGASAMDFGRAWPPDYRETFRINTSLYVAGDLPYTARRGNFNSFIKDDTSDQGIDDSTDTRFATLLAPAPNALHATERAFYRLEMGLALLDWADTLYRSDQGASVARARELYKGVTFLHGARPRIDPEWTPKSLASSSLMNASNPATLSQFWRAKIGFTQINAGLNWFGYADDMVPQLRYMTLKPAADAFAAEAAAAERDFLTAMTRIEEATVDAMKNSAMLNRARLQSEIAKQQAGVVADQVVQANALIAQVNAQIAKAQKDADDHDSFFGQLGDYLSGMASIAKGGGEIISTSKAFGMAGGASQAEVDSTVAMSGAAAGMSGYAAFFIASYITMSSMSDAANQRQQTLSLLGSSNLPSAQAQLDIANRSATIAQLQQSVAQSDSDLATSLLAFGQDRFLSSEFWTRMARLFQRSLRAYLDLAARAGWLAERALAYEQNRTLRIMGFDYYPASTQGAGGAARLLLDLADVEASRLAGLQEMVPIKLTYSLARDFPLAFAQLQATGSCVFRTSDAALQAMYPGCFGFRVLAATPRLVRGHAGAPMRGILANGGVSQISSADGTLRLSVRPPDGLPVSDFDISTSDMNVFGLPGATLMQFEGSGIETVWQFLLPVAANPGGFGPLADALLTFDLRAQFSGVRFAAVTGAPPVAMSKTLVISAGRTAPVGLLALQDKAMPSAEINFDLAALGLPSAEKKRAVGNLFVVLVGASSMPSIAGKLSVGSPAKTIAISLLGGIAYSNAPPITDALSTSPKSPLNALAGSDAAQLFILSIDKTVNAGVDFAQVVDVLLGIDYTATL